MRLLFVALLGLVIGCVDHGAGSTVTKQQQPDPPDDPDQIVIAIHGRVTQVENPEGLVDATVGDTFSGTIRYKAGRSTREKVPTAPPSIGTTSHRRASRSRSTTPRSRPTPITSIS